MEDSDVRPVVHGLSIRNLHNRADGGVQVVLLLFGPRAFHPLALLPLHLRSLHCFCVQRKLGCCRLSQRKPFGVLIVVDDERDVPVPLRCRQTVEGLLQAEKALVKHIIC